MSSSPRQVRCPQCGNNAPWSTDNPWRPFCCERCKQIDLGAWANDSYSIAGQAASADDSPPARDD